ncbi:protein-lysine N-methyltransferase EEF2KMT-like [Ctenocephalides felis]|uniref:protein-lysine N-methyltransferase EEF2KMT-like n=1 Tax=Ctenocephalides felis TaxID=7515 RepID=UPI000E6E262E|nr:protein-lysine N-methyltransferase EEF2KMT-like [Ctenocephalides felis]
MNVKEVYDEKVYKLISWVQKQFLSGEPVTGDFFEDLLKDITWDNQQILLNSTVLHPLVKKYPIKKEYQRNFVRSIICTLEKQNIEVHDDLYTNFCILNTEENCDKKSYKHYIVDKGGLKTIITIKESISFVSEGTTGLCSWELISKCSQALAEYFIENSNLVKNQTILELGAGTGLTALFLWTICEPKKYYVSDCHKSVLDLLSDNIALNFSDQRNEYLEFTNFTVCTENKMNDVDTRFIKTWRSPEDNELSVVNLLWEDTDYLEEFSDIDLILAADVVYDPSIIPCVATALNYY